MVSGLIPFIERPQTPANSRFCLDKVATEPPLRASALQLPRSRMARGKGRANSIVGRPRPPSSAAANAGLAGRPLAWRRAAACGAAQRGWWRTGSS